MAYVYRSPNKYSNVGYLPVVYCVTISILL